jgi:hypothetical protein
MALRDNLREKWFKNNSRSYKDRDVKFGRSNKDKWQPTNMNDINGKGSAPRNKNISSEEEDLRWKLAFGKISEEEFNKAMKGLHGETN